MKKIAAAALSCALTLLTAIPIVHASDLRMTVEQPRFTCAGRGTILSHVSYVPSLSDAAAPLPCCNGQLGCAQFLSTNTILHPHHELRG